MMNLHQFQAGAVPPAQAHHVGSYVAILSLGKGASLPTDLYATDVFMNA